MKWLNDHMICLQEHVEQQYVTRCIEYDALNLVERHRYFNITQEV